MILFTSISGFLCYILLSTGSLEVLGTTFRDVPPINFDLAIIFGLTVLIGGYLGSHWGLKSLKTRNVQMIFIAIIIIVGFQLLLRVAGVI
jgi:uncharacterized membrane protein YfcA